LWHRWHLTFWGKEMIEIAICLLALAFASLSDLRKREIESRYWKLMVFFGIVLFTWKFIRTGDESLIFELLISFATTFVITMALAHVGFMGMADAELLVGMSVLVPTFSAPFTIFPVLALGVFTNAIFLAAFVPLLFFAKNLRHLSSVRSFRGLSMLLLGYRKRASDVGRHEAVIKEGDRYRLFLNVKKAKLGERKEGEEEVWVTPALPFVLFLTVGFLISVTYGDLASLILYLFSVL